MNNKVIKFLKWLCLFTFILLLIVLISYFLFKEYDDKNPEVDSNQLIVEEKPIEEDYNKGKTRVYVRAYDYNTPSKLTLEKQGNYIGECYQTAFPEATVLVSTAKLTKQEFYSEMDSFFQDNEENDINYIIFTGHGSKDGYIFLHYGSGTKLQEIRKEHLDTYKGKIFLNLSACFIGRFFDTGFGRETFRDEIDALNGKYSILAGSSSESTYIPNEAGPNVDDCGKWASGLAKIVDDYGIEHIKADINDDGILTVDELRRYGLLKPYATETYSYPRNDQSVIMTVDKLSLVAHACGGTFADETEEKIITYNRNSIIKNFPTPVKEGCIFDGWYDDSYEGNIISFPLELTNNVHIWARWRKDDEVFYKSDVNNLDTLRIPLKNGGYTDFLIVNKDFTSNVINKSTLTCEADEGMYLLNLNGVGSSHFFETVDDVGDWDKCLLKVWLENYYQLLPNQLLPYIFNNTVKVGTITEAEKIFILSTAELKASVTDDKYEEATSGYWWPRFTSMIDYLPSMHGKSAWNLSLTQSNLNNSNFLVKPAMNVSLTADDLYYDFSEGVYKVKFIPDDVIEFVKPDKDYVVKVNGEIVYTATGEIKSCCDAINTLALVPWKLDYPVYYKYLGNLRSILQPGNYRGIPYAGAYDMSFHDYENVLDAFLEGDDKVKGLECTSAVVYGLRLGLENPGDLLLYNGKSYGVAQYIADALHDEEGTMTSYGGGTVRFGDYLHYVGNYGEYDFIAADTPCSQYLIEGIIANANYAEGDIYTNVYAKIMPGDCLIRHFHEEGADPSQLRNHAQLCTGVELVYDEEGNLDIQKSGVYYTDIDAPHNSTIALTGEVTAWTNDETTKSNFISFEYMVTEQYVLPLRLNRWY